MATKKRKQKTEAPEMKRWTLEIPQDLYEAIEEEARREGLAAVHIARLWLNEKRRANDKARREAEAT